MVAGILMSLNHLMLSFSSSVMDTWSRVPLMTKLEPFSHSAWGRSYLLGLHTSTWLANKVGQQHHTNANRPVCKHRHEGFTAMHEKAL